MIKVCCSIFQKFLVAAGKPDMAIIPRKEFGKRYFALQNRIFEFHVSEYLSKKDPDTGFNKYPMIKDEHGSPIPIALATTIAILYCPFCGTKLDDIIEANLEEFDIKAKESQKFFEK